MNRLNIRHRFPKVLQIRILGFNILGCPDNFLSYSSLFLDQQANACMLHKCKAAKALTSQIILLVSSIADEFLCWQRPRSRHEDSFRSPLSDLIAYRVLRRGETLEVRERHAVENIVGGHANFFQCRRSTHCMHQSTSFSQREQSVGFQICLEMPGTKYWANPQPAKVLCCLPALP